SPAIELNCRAAQEERGQRQAHAEIADEVHEGVVDSAGLSGPGICPTRLVEGADLLAVEDDQGARPAALFRLHTQAVRATEGERAYLVPLDLLPGRLDRVVGAMHGHAQSRWLANEVRHPTTPAPMRIGTAIATFPDGSLGGTPNREVGEIRAAATCFCLSIRKSWRRPYVASFDGTSARPRRQFKRLSTGPDERNDDNI